MEKKYVLAVDQSTQGTKAILFDANGDLVCRTDLPHRQLINEKGWVSHDLSEIYSNTIQVVKNLVEKAGIQKEEIACLGISNQRETSAAWSRNTGEPLAPAIVWQCSRASEICERIKTNVMIDPDREQKKNGGVAEIIRQKTGMHLSPYFPAAKFAWLQENVEEVKQAKRDNDLCLGTIDTWLIYNLTGGVTYATDYTNASRTMLFDIHRLDWDDDLCKIFGVPRSMLPEPRPSSGSFGEVSADIMRHHPRILGVAGDQQASLFGHCCFDPGGVKNTYGTGCFMLMNLGSRAVTSQNGLVTTIGIAEGGRVDYALEGSVFQAGSVIQWLRDGLGLIEHAGDTAAIASSVPDAGGCYVVPAFTGLGAPWWRPAARGLIAGITRGTARARLVRAACESMAYQTYDILKAMEADSGHALSALAVDGGAANNDFIMQFQADLLGIDVVRAGCAETTALGAAFLAGLACGFWADREELASLAEGQRAYAPAMPAERAAELLEGWHEAVRRTIS